MATQQTTPGGNERAGTGTQRERWVVGVDGSPGARAALVWALTAAAQAGAALELVSSYPVDFYWADPYLLDIVRLDEIRADTARLVTDALAEARRTRPSSPSPELPRWPPRSSWAAGQRPSTSSRRPRAPSGSWSAAVGGAACAAPCSAP